ncbi:thioredoxin family protein [Sinorhizobium medicae]|uniref:thioredoxin family protein n=1 Tax=Sinorhizobium medicae TaxID=110321 RepID=UPI001F266F24|nr:thioredoxin domain-containing protein [Sinorhizobium medicae]
MNTTFNEHPTAIVTVDTSNFPQEVLNSPLPVVVIFSRGWSPCEMIEPILEQIATELAGKVKVVKLNADVPPELPAKYGVSSFQRLAMFKGGEVTVADVAFGSLRSWVSHALA